LTHLTGFWRLLARHDLRRALAEHKWVVTLLQRAQKVRALLGQIRPYAPLPRLPDAPHRASCCAWPNERICHHQTGQGLLPLVWNQAEL